MIEIDSTANISSLADIEDSIRGTKIRIGARTVIDSFVKIKPAGGIADLLIGTDCVINSGCVLYTGNGIHIGNNVAIAANCTLAPANHEFQSKNTLIRNQGFKQSKGGIIIEDDVWIGANCVLLDGTILRQGCVIGAGSVVRGEIPPFSIYGGNPLRQLGIRL
jgi:virginiamycin A acetyltransferase